MHRCAVAGVRSAVGFGTADVIQEVVEQFDSRRLGVTRLALLVKSSDLTIAKT